MVDKTYRQSENDIDNIENPRNTFERGAKTKINGVDMGPRGYEAAEIQTNLC